MCSYGPVLKTHTHLVGEGLANLLVALSPNATTVVGEFDVSVGNVLKAEERAE